MDLLLLSLDHRLIPGFLDECVGKPPAATRLGYLSDAAVGMPFAGLERDAVEALGYAVSEARARESEAEVFARWLDTCDAVYVAGGETFVLLEALQVSGNLEVLAARVRDGLPYVGCSAGSVIAGPTIAPVDLMDDRALAPALLSDVGLGLVDRVIVPHADGMIPSYPVELVERIVARYGEEFPLLLLHDDQALRVSREGEVIVSFGTRG